MLCLGVDARTREEALTKAVAAARTAVQNAAIATLRWEPSQLKSLDGDEPKLTLLHDRKPPVPWTLLPPAELERRRNDRSNMPTGGMIRRNGARTGSVSVKITRRTGFSTFIEPCMM